ncbi:MAG: hypothetical protein WA147_08730 [Polaromonas sp.]
MHQLERHRNGPAVAVVQRVQEVNPFDRAILAMVVMPTDQVALVSPGFFLDGVVKNQHAFSGLHFPHHRFDYIYRIDVALSTGITLTFI